MIEKKESLEKKLKDAVRANVRRKLIPYVQMYEFEGLLFSSPESMETTLNEAGVRDWAYEILSQFQNNPEDINDSVETAPSKRLINQTRYRKTTHGPDIARETGIDRIRQMCSGFDAWLASLENLVEH